MGLTANVVQHGPLRISRLAVETPALILLRQGEKALAAGTRRWQARGGDIVVVASAPALDVENRLSAAGLFEARWLVWDVDLFAKAEGAVPRRPALSGVAVVKGASSDFVAAIDRAVEAIAQAPAIPEAVAVHRMIELLLWLREHGIALGASRAVSTTSRLRALIGAEPGAAWTAGEAAGRLAVSETTLRRRLLGEGARFHDLLADTRMSLALSLLQSTDRPVADIAAQLGYQSGSRFAIRFRSRFGFAPTAVRGHQR